MNPSEDFKVPDASENNHSENFHIALLSAYAVGLHSLERIIPAPIPWLRFGFVNIITLTSLLLYGLKAGIMITLIRVFVSSLFAGTFLGPSFVLSLGGGISSTFAMWGAGSLFGRLLSPVGISLIGALVHNIAQLFIAYLLFVKRLEAILIIGPFIILIGVFTGSFNGFVTTLIVKSVKEKRHRTKKV
jgi:heptaprenyl diphosphate synthase